MFDPLQNSSAPSAEDIDPEVPDPSKAIGVPGAHVRLTDGVPPFFFLTARTLPEQNLLGEEAGRGSEESHAFRACPRAPG